jgi:hypothetical protein
MHQKQRIDMTHSVVIPANHLVGEMIRLIKRIKIQVKYLFKGEKKIQKFSIEDTSII